MNPPSHVNSTSIHPSVTAGNPNSAIPFKIQHLGNLYLAEITRTRQIPRRNSATGSRRFHHPILEVTQFFAHQPPLI